MSKRFLIGNGVGIEEAKAISEILKINNGIAYLDLGGDVIVIQVMIEFEQLHENRK